MMDWYSSQFVGHPLCWLWL